ncbi:hypothetical protein ACMZ6W_04125 [Streptococcus pluranimalium]
MDIKTAQRFEKLSEHQISRQQELIRSLEAKEMSVMVLLQSLRLKNTISDQPSI